MLSTWGFFVGLSKASNAGNLQSEMAAGFRMPETGNDLRF